MTADLPLHDIVEQPAVSWWPLAWGWWLILAGALGATLVGLWYWHRRQRFLAPWRHARQELAQCQHVEACNMVLKRVLRHYQPNLWQEPISPTDWLAVLSSCLPLAQRDAFVRLAEPGLSRLYTGQVEASHLADCQQACALWLRHYRPPRRQPHV